jgi:hypothetical protein
MFIEGAKWNYDKMELDESDPKVLIEFIIIFRYYLPNYLSCI